MKQSFLTTVAAILCAFALIASGPALAQDAMFIDANGRVGIGVNAVPDGMYSLVFTIWDDTAGGNLLWTETHLVQTKSGLWNATLGSLTQLPVDVMAPSSSNSLEPRYLQMEFDGELIQPRRRMGGLPFAGAAQRLRGDINTGPGRVEMVQIDPANDSGVTIEIGVGLDSTGEMVGRLVFYETVDDGFRASSSKPKEIVVVGSKIKENYSHYFNVQNNISDYEFVKGQASGKRTYGPILFSSAVLPDTIPGYSMTVDSNGTELMMAKNNSDGSSCWIRTSQTHSGSIDSMVSANSARKTKRIDKSTPLIAQALCRNESIDGSFASVEQLVGVDSGYSHSIFVTDGSSSMQTDGDVDGRDYLIWQRGGTTTGSDSVSNYQFLSIDSGFGQSLFLTNGTTTMHSDVDGRDFLIWQRNYGMTTGSNDLQSSEHMSVDSGFISEISNTDGTTECKKVTKIESFTIKQSISSSNAGGDLSEVVMESAGDNSALRISDLTTDRHQSQYIDDTSSTFEIYQNIIARTKIEKIALKNTPSAGSRLYVGNLGFNSSDGFRVNADLAGGTKVGINVGTPTSTLDVNGTLEIGNGTPISQVLSVATTLDFPSTTTGSTSDLPITIVGASVGDVVSLGVPSGSVLPSSIYTAWVSGTNVVTVRFANMATFSQNPASGSFRAMITKF